MFDEFSLFTLAHCLRHTMHSPSAQTELSSLNVGTFLHDPVLKGSSEFWVLCQLFIYIRNLLYFLGLNCNKVTFLPNIRIRILGKVALPQELGTKVILEKVSSWGRAI